MDTVDFGCTVVGFSGGHQVTVTGDVDFATSPRLADALSQFANGDVRLDLSGVTFMDSSGLRVLTVAQRSLHDRGRRLTICGPINRVVRRTMEITGVIDMLTFDEAFGARRAPGDDTPQRAA